MLTAVGCFLALFFALRLARLLIEGGHGKHDPQHRRDAGHRPAARPVESREHTR